MSDVQSQGLQWTSFEDPIISVEQVVEHETDSDEPNPRICEDNRENEPNVQNKTEENALEEAFEPTLETESLPAHNKARNKTEKELRECRYCSYQAEDWPQFSRHVFTTKHIKRVAEAYNIRLTKDQMTCFTCELCKVTCQGPTSFHDHMTGGRHVKNLLQQFAQEESKSKTGKMVTSILANSKKPYDRPAKSKAKTKAVSSPTTQFANHPQPLIGLEYVTEIQAPENVVKYECSACKMKFDNGVKFLHLVGQKHRLNVLKIKRPEFAKQLNSGGKKRSAEISTECLKEAMALEMEEGRQEIKVKVEKFPVGNQQTVKARGIRDGGSPAKNVRGKGNANRGVSNIRPQNLPSQRNAFNFRGSYESASFSPSLSYQNYNNAHTSTFRQMSYSESYRALNYGGGSGQSSQYGQTYTNLIAPSSNQGYLPISPAPPHIQSHSNAEVFVKKSPCLANALGDLSDLIKTNDDASMALQVSNALTKALLQIKRASGRE